MFCQCKFDEGKGIRKLPDQDTQLGIVLEAYPSRKRYKINGSYWKCLNCEHISSRLNGNQKLCDCLESILQEANAVKNDTILTLSYAEVETLHTVFVPKLLGVEEIGRLEAEMPSR